MKFLVLLLSLVGWLFMEGRAGRQAVKQQRGLYGSTWYLDVVSSYFMRDKQYNFTVFLQINGVERSDYGKKLFLKYN